MSFGYQVLGFGTIGSSPVQGYTHVAGVGQTTVSNSASTVVGMPSGIQANDIIYVVQNQLIVSAAGYGNPTASAGTGFTDALGNSGYYGYTPYAFAGQASFFKVAAGNESGQNISGFANSTNVGGNAVYRTTFVDVFRPVIGVSTVGSVHASQGASGVFSSGPATLSRTRTSPSAGVCLGLVMQMSYQSNAINITASGHNVIKTVDYAMPTGYYSHCKYRFFTVPPSTDVTVASNSVYGPHGIGVNVKSFTP